MFCVDFLPSYYVASRPTAIDAVVCRWELASESARRILVMVLKDLAPSLPVLLLCTAHSDAAELPLEIRSLFRRAHTIALTTATVETRCE